jgi:Putative zinc-finger
MTTQSMNHKQAVETMAAERYLLGEMTGEQRLAFEEHYVDCAECLESVMFGSEFLDAGREVALEQSSRAAAPVPTWRERLLAVGSSFLRPAPALAFALLLCLTGYQTFRIYQLKNEGGAKVATAEFRYVLTGVAHGAGDAKLVQAPRDAVVSLGLEYNRGGEYLSYRAQIMGETGAIKQSVALPNTPGNMATIALMPGSLPDGDYTMLILGKTADGHEQEVGHGSFRLQTINK